MTTPTRRRSHAFGMRIGRRTNIANVANTLSQASTELAKASAHYRRADDELSAPHKRSNRESGLAQAVLGARFVFEALEQDDVDVLEVVKGYLAAKDDEDEDGCDDEDRP